MPQPTTQYTNLPITLNPAQRQLLEGAAALKGLRLSTWVRSAALEASRAEMEREQRQQMEQRRADSAREPAPAPATPLDPTAEEVQV